MIAGALLSPDGRYRYRLWRRWDEGRPLLFVMLNPSTADAEQDDPTIRKCVGFARPLGFHALEVVNLFAFRSTAPLGIRAVTEPVGLDNDRHILEAAKAAGLVVAAWGRQPQHPPWLAMRARHVLALLADVADVHALQLNQDGQPAHPLYLPPNLKPFLFRSRRSAA